MLSQFLHRLRTGATLALTALALGAAPSALAQVPSEISYQGVLTDAAGAVSSSGLELSFALYPSLSGGTAVWTETQPSVPVADGRFAVDLGRVAPLDGVAFDQPYWLEVAVDGTPLTPRTPFTSAPYARRAAAASAAPWSGLTNVPSGFADGVDNVGSNARTGCAAYLFPYVPYGANVSQLFYVTQIDPVSWFAGGTSTGPSYNVEAYAVDDFGNEYDLGTLLQTSGRGVYKLSSQIYSALTALGFTSGKLALAFRLVDAGSGSPAVDETVSFYGGYNVGGGDRGAIEIECLQ